MKELLKMTSPVVSLTSIARTADANGTGADLLGYNSALVVATAGADSGLDGSNYIAFELEESDDNSTFTDVAAADMLCESPASASTGGQFWLIDSTTEDDVIAQVAYKGEKRYIRVVANITGTVNIVCSAIVLRGHPSSPPST